MHAIARYLTTLCIQVGLPTYYNIRCKASCTLMAWQKYLIICSELPHSLIQPLMFKFVLLIVKPDSHCAWRSPCGCSRNTTSAFNLHQKTLDFWWADELCGFCWTWPPLLVTNWNQRTFLPLQRYNNRDVNRCMLAAVFVQSAAKKTACCDKWEVLHVWESIGINFPTDNFGGNNQL